MIAAVILDFDGLIVDTETPIFEEWRGLYEGHGQRLDLGLWQRALGTHGGFDPLVHLEGLVGRPIEPALVAAVRERSHARCRLQPLLPGVRALLDDAAALDMRVAVASSSTGPWVEGFLERHGIRGLVAAVCTRGDVKNVKPAPDLFLLAASRLGVAPPSCVVFEDSPNGIRAAIAAGMRCVIVANGVTKSLDFPPADLRLASLDELPLRELLELLDARA